MEATHAKVKQNTANSKLSAIIADSKRQLTADMIESKTPFKSVGNNKFIVLVNTKKQPTRNDELLVVVLRKWMQVSGQAITEADINKYLEVLVSCEAALMTTTPTVKLQEGKPVSALLG